MSQHPAREVEEKKPTTITFMGMDNVSDPSKLDDGYSPYLINVDCDETDGVYTRPISPYIGEAAQPLYCDYHGRTYRANGNNLEYSTSIDDYGTRHFGGKLETYTSGITMLVNMIDGLFVGTQDECVFISGGDPALGDMTQVQVNKWGVTSGTCCKVDNVNMGKEGQGYSVIFLSHNGICVGSNGGGFENVSNRIVAIPKSLVGEAIIRYDRNMTFYIVKTFAQVGSQDKFIPIETDGL